jgi:hypothetical protein
MFKNINNDNTMSLFNEKGYLCICVCVCVCVAY